MTVDRNNFEYKDNGSAHSARSAGVSGTTTGTGASYLSRYDPYKPNSSNRASSIIDEDQLARTFQEIVNCIHLDEDEDSGNAASVGRTNGKPLHPHQNQNHDHDSSPTATSLLPDFTSIFGSGFNVAVGGNGTATVNSAGLTTKSTSGSGNAPSSDDNPSSNPPGTAKSLLNFEGMGKSFLDDDWMPVVRRNSEGISVLNLNHRGDHSNQSSERNDRESRPFDYSSVPSPSSPAVPLRTMTPSNNGPIGYPVPVGSQSISASNSTSNSAFTPRGPPGDYVCKLCSNNGHWMKDCRLYEPRTPPASLNSNSSSSFKSKASYSGSMSQPTSSNSSGTAVFASRTTLPPGNYVCRLCGVAGHWIDQCAKFQPKAFGTLGAESSPSAVSDAAADMALPPMFGVGPTPNYRPPAYLSKPVPANYICNLCGRPGHWIQQCVDFTPIISHKPRENGPSATSSGNSSRW